MTLLTIILFLLGIGILILGWRWQSPQDTELLTALKGLVQLKRELEKVKGNLQALEGRVERLPVTTSESELVLKDLVGEAAMALQSSQLPGPLMLGEPVGKNLKQAQTGFDTRQDFRPGAPEGIGVSSYREAQSQAARLQNESSLHRDEGIRDKALPEKYLKVLEMADAGLTLKEIARELSLSQDAVGLVLRTYPRGGRV